MLALDIILWKLASMLSLLGLLLSNRILVHCSLSELKGVGGGSVEGLWNGRLFTSFPEITQLCYYTHKIQLSYYFLQNYNNI